MFQLLSRSDYMIVAMFYRFIWYSVGVTPSNSHFKDVYKDWLKERIKVRRFREYQHFILSFSLMKKLPERQTSFSPGQGSEKQPSLWVKYHRIIIVATVNVVLFRYFIATKLNWNLSCLQARLAHTFLFIHNFHGHS